MITTAKYRKEIILPYRVWRCCRYNEIANIAEGMFLTYCANMEQEERLRLPTPNGEQLMPLTGVEPE